MSNKIEIHEIYVSPGHDFKGRFGKSRLNHEVVSLDAVDCVEGKGLVGDRYFGFGDDYKGQLSLISTEMIAEVEGLIGMEVADLRAFRRNVILSGVDLNALVGKRFELGGVRLEGSEQCRPCFWMNEAIGDGAHDAMEQRGGLRCRILSSGTLRKGVVELREE